MGKSRAPRRHAWHAKKSGRVVPIITSAANSDSGAIAATRVRTARSSVVPTTRVPGKKALSKSLRQRRPKRAGPVLEPPPPRRASLPPHVKPVPGNDPRFQDMVQVPAFTGTAHHARKSGAGLTGLGFFQSVADPDAGQTRTSRDFNPVRKKRPLRTAHDILFFQPAAGGWAAPQLNANPILQLPCIDPD